jgi:hypothetical protein
VICTPQSDNWFQHNINFRNDRYNKNIKFKESDIDDIKFRCEVNYTRTESSSYYQATPLIVDDVMYWSGNAGYMGAAHIPCKVPTDEQCADIWVVNVRDVVYSDITLNFDTLSARVTPAYYETADKKGKIVSVAATPIVFGQASQHPEDWFKVSMRIFQLDAATGALDWVYKLDDPSMLDDTLHSAFTAPTIHKGIAYFGLSAALNANYISTAYLENKFPGQFPYQVRGQMIAFDLTAVSVKWRQYTIPKRPASLAPEDAWFSGGGVWSSGPSILERGCLSDLVIWGSGQLYSAPNDTIDCLNRNGSVYGTTYLGDSGGGCIDCYNEVNSTEFDIPLMSNSIIALDSNTGDVVWFHNEHGIDIWLVTCGLFSQTSGCLADIVPSFYPKGMTKILAPGPDADFSGAAGTVIKYEDKSYVAGLTKLNQLVVLNGNDGSVFWTADLGPGSVMGGSSFGFAYDPKSHTFIVAVTPSPMDETYYSSSPLQKLNSHRAANGVVYCTTAIVKAIDFETAKIQWEIVAPFHNDVSNLKPQLVGKCTDLNAGEVNSVDRFKHGLPTTHYLQHLAADPSIPVHVMLDPIGTPWQGTSAGAVMTPGVIGRGIYYWGISGGTIFATRITDGVTINAEGFSCEEGGFYGTGLMVTENRIAFGCGWRYPGQTLSPTMGSKVRVLQLNKHKDNDCNDGGDDDLYSRRGGHGRKLTRRNRGGRKVTRRNRGGRKVTRRNRGGRRKK